MAMARSAAASRRVTPLVKDSQMMEGSGFIRFHA